MNPSSPAQDSTTSVKQKRGKNITEEERITRNQERAKRNKISAINSREKKRKYVSDLEQENEALKKRVKLVEEQNLELNGKFEDLKQLIFAQNNAQNLFPPNLLQNFPSLTPATSTTTHNPISSLLNVDTSFANSSSPPSSLTTFPSASFPFQPISPPYSQLQSFPSLSSIAPTNSQSSFDDSLTKFLYTTGLGETARFPSQQQIPVAVKNIHQQLVQSHLLPKVSLIFASLVMMALVMMESGMKMTNSLTPCLTRCLMMSQWTTEEWKGMSRRYYHYLKRRRMRTGMRFGKNLFSVDRFLVFGFCDV
jgi:hypothetical protein